MVHDRVRTQRRKMPIVVTRRDQTPAKQALQCQGDASQRSAVIIRPVGRAIGQQPHVSVDKDQLTVGLLGGAAQSTH